MKSDIPLSLTPDEAAMLHRAFVHGVYGGPQSTVQSLTAKLERAEYHARGVRAVASSIAATAGASNGKEKVIV